MWAARLRRTSDLEQHKAPKIFKRQSLVMARGTQKKNSCRSWACMTDFPAMEDTEISKQVATLLQNLNPHRACGPDGIWPRLLKEFARDCTCTDYSFQVLPVLWLSSSWLERCTHHTYLQVRRAIQPWTTGWYLSPVLCASSWLTS